MTEPVRPLEALIEQWRTGEYRSQRMCADELAALLQAAAPPAPTAEPDVIQTVVRVTCGARNFNATLPVSDYQRIIALLSGFAYTRMDELESQAPAPPERVSEGKDDYKAKYHELLYAVGNKHQGENRHETALRYIRQAETSSGPHAGCQCQIDAHDFNCPVHGTARPAVEPREEPTHE